MSLEGLHALLCSSPGRDMRKRRLLDSASLRLVLLTLPRGPVAEGVGASAEFAEWWMLADLMDAGLDERERMLRAYDRRQLRNPVLQRIDRVRASEFAGTPTKRRQAEFHTLQVASELLYDDYDSRRLWATRQFLNSTVDGERQLAMAHDIFGDPTLPISFSPEWRTDTAIALARMMYESREFGAMPILADALQDAGCDDTHILDHCRDTSLPHVRGCWVVDLVLGKK